jgi:hypothetical protein
MKTAVIFSTTLAICVPASASAKPHCPQIPGYAQAEAWDERVRSGDPHAASCLALRLRVFDGDRRPVELLELAHRGELSRDSLSDAVRMLSLSLTDEFPAQLAAMKARRERFRRVTRPELASERRIALESIDSALAEIKANVPSR